MTPVILSLTLSVSKYNDISKLMQKHGNKFNPQVYPTSFESTAKATPARHSQVNKRSAQGILKT
jgi:hypothetical protein